MDLCQAKNPAAVEAQRLRTVLRKQPRGVILRMVVDPGEQAAIWAELSEAERVRVELLTAWPWAQPALASARRAAA